MTISTGTTRTTERRVHHAGFGVLLLLTMAASTFAMTAFSVLSHWLLDAFDLSRWQLGTLITATAIVGALFSPLMGRVSDRVGGRRALQITLALSALVLAGIAVSHVFLVLMATALAAGLAQAGANPATNKLIAVHVPAGRQGTATGIKQSGVQAGVLLGGSLLPLGATSIGWRPTLLIAATIPALGLLASRLAVPADTAGTVEPDRTVAPARSPFLLRLALYGFLIGAGWSAIFTYLPDYAQTSLGWSPTTAGLLVSVSGAFGVAGRIGWSWLAEHRLGAAVTLMTLAGIGGGAVLCLLVSQPVPAVAWAAAAAFGASSGAWNAVGMFAIVNRMPSAAAGAASGFVMLGFLVGLGVGAPPFGWSIDVTGSYVIGLMTVLALHVAALWMAATLRHAPVGPQTDVVHR